MDSPESQSHDLVKFLAWLEVNKKRVALGAGGLIVLIIVIIGVVQSRAAREDQASQALSEVRAPRSIGEAPSAETLDGYLRVAREFAGTKAGERALALAGAGFFAAGNYPEAQKQLEALVKQYPESPWLPEASLGLAATFAAQGRTNEAEAKYEEVRRRHGASPVVDDAKLALGRLYEAKGSNEAAFKLYEELTRAAGSFQGGAAMEAQVRRQDLLKKHPELAMPKEVLTSAPPALTATGRTVQLTNLISKVVTSPPGTLKTNIYLPSTNRPTTNVPLLLKAPATTTNR
jgi:tetratricopeptide (TPR) repeat protein